MMQGHIDQHRMAGRGLRLGRILGIEVRLDPSWYIVFFLVTWALATGLFPANLPGVSPLAHWWLGLTASILFFGAILAHELGHCIVSRWRGIPVREVTLFIFGGVARLDREPRRAGDDLLIALAGPAASLLVAVLFGAIWRLGDAVPDPYAVMARWLAEANLMLALFNLLPGFPLDGGRVVCALVWGATGSRLRGTAVAATLGRLMGLGLIVLGIWQALGGHWLVGLWLALIGWFLARSAAAAQGQAVAQDLLAGRAVSEAMADTPVVHPWLTLDVVVQDMLLPGGWRSLPVADRQDLCGVITLQSAMALPRKDWPHTRVSQVMLPRDRLQTVAPDTDLAVAYEAMRLAGSPACPVLEDGRLVGMISQDGVLRYLKRRGVGETARQRGGQR